MDINEKLDRAHEQWENDYNKKVKSLDKLIDDAKARNDHWLVCKLQTRQAREQDIIDKKLFKFHTKYIIEVCGFADEDELNSYSKGNMK